MSFHFYDRPSEFHGLGDQDDDEPAEDRCHTCGERVPEGAGGFVEGEGRQCQDCIVEWREAAREEATRC